MLGRTLFPFCRTRPKCCCYLCHCRDARPTTPFYSSILVFPLRKRWHWQSKKNCNFSEERNFCTIATNKLETVKKRGEDSNKSNLTVKDFMNMRRPPPEQEAIYSLDMQPSVSHPYLENTTFSGNGRKVFLETHGCQMNFADMEIVRSVLKANRFVECATSCEADVVLIMTCAIREGAEQKIRRKLFRYQAVKKQRRKSGQNFTVGVLGCMAERLKESLLEQESSVDLIAGPDSYRDLPRLLSLSFNGQSAVNVMLSHDETYADIAPVRISADSVSAFVSIMRGCDNMCTYCIVPFTRGRERSRPIDTIIDEVRKLSDQGVKELTLLGQNVNSYRDLTESVHHGIPSSHKILPVEGFRTVYKAKSGGRRFAELLEAVSQIDPEMRIRFTSPHPKDFPDEVLEIIRDRANVCNQLHLPAQSGNSKVLNDMGRGYTRETYMMLIEKVKALLGPDICITSDFIAGFCGETEAEHHESLSLIRHVGYNFCYCFPYSMREKTRAHRRLVDNVDEPTKKRRANELIAAFREEALKLHLKLIGAKQTVLIEGVSKRSPNAMAGRNDGGTKVIVENCLDRPIKQGDYVLVEITDASSQVLKGVALSLTNITATDIVQDSAQESASRIML